MDERLMETVDDIYDSVKDRMWAELGRASFAGVDPKALHAAVMDDDRLAGLFPPICSRCGEYEARKRHDGDILEWYCDGCDDWIPTDADWDGDGNGNGSCVSKVVSRLGRMKKVVAAAKKFHADAPKCSACLTEVSLVWPRRDKPYYLCPHCDDRVPTDDDWDGTTLEKENENS